MELHNRDKKSGKFLYKVKSRWENDVTVIKKDERSRGNERVKLNV
jgi:hypothetical protein